MEVKMTKRKIIPYNPKLKQLARNLRNDSTKSEIKLWQQIKGKQILGYDFHRQKPLLDYIVDFYCHELQLVIELDGYSHQLEDVYDKDTLKTKKLEEYGLTILRFQDEEVMKDMPNVLKAIEQYIVNFETHP